jgi:hypothetical protein
LRVAKYFFKEIVKRKRLPPVILFLFFSDVASLASIPSGI